MVSGSSKWPNKLHLTWPEFEPPPHINNSTIIKTPISNVFPTTFRIFRVAKCNWMASIFIPPSPSLRLLRHGDIFLAGKSISKWKIYDSPQESIFAVFHNKKWLKTLPNSISQSLVIALDNTEDTTSFSRLISNKKHGETSTE